MIEYRRILLDGYPTLVERHGERLVARDGAQRRRGRRGASGALRADQDHLRPPELLQPGGRAHDEAAAGAHILP